jgi:hypothetical protein
LLNKPEIINKHSLYEFENPFFEIFTRDYPQRIWWQITADKEFKLICPSLDNVHGYQDKITISDLEATFFNNDTRYYFRCKTERAGVWSEWSEIYEFSVLKPQQPQISDSAMEILNYEPETDYYVFGSDRLDFIPEIYAKLSYVSYTDFPNLTFEKNENLIGIYKQRLISIDLKYPFYRVIAKKGNAFSVPSSIIRNKQQQGVVLQCRTYFSSEEKRKSGHCDYRAELMNLS